MYCFILFLKLKKCLLNLTKAYLIITFGVGLWDGYSRMDDPALRYAILYDHGGLYSSLNLRVEGRQRYFHQLQLLLEL